MVAKDGALADATCRSVFTTSNGVVNVAAICYEINISSQCTQGKKEYEK